MAQLVAREVWDFDAAGSNPVTPTKNQPKMRFFAPLSADFLLIIGFYPPLCENPLTAEMRLVPHLQHKPLFSEGFFFAYRDAIFDYYNSIALIC